MTRIAGPMIPVYTVAQVGLKNLIQLRESPSAIPAGEHNALPSIMQTRAETVTCPQVTRAS